MVDFRGKSHELNTSNLPLYSLRYQLFILYQARTLSDYSTYRNVATCHQQTFAQCFTYCRRHSGGAERYEVCNKVKTRTSHSSYFWISQSFRMSVLGCCSCCCCYSSRRRNRESPHVITLQSLFKKSDRQRPGEKLTALCWSGCAMAYNLIIFHTYYIQT